MHGLRKVILGCAVASLALVSLGAAPAAAADTTGTLVIVQGRPGVNVDICIGSKEQRSNKAFGSVYEKDVIGTGARLLRFFKYNPNKKCGGTLIAKKVLHITPGWDQTIVLTKFNPKIVMFDNTSPYLGEIPPRGASIASAALFAWVNAADFTTNFHYTYWSPNPELPIGPAVNPVWAKGARLATSFPDDYYMRIRATLPEQADTVAQRAAYLKESRRYEFVLVGTNPNNARFMLINRGVSAPSP